MIPDLFSGLEEKAAALGISLVSNHAFVDGNKHFGHAALEVFLVLNGWELNAGVKEQDPLILRFAAGLLKREDFTASVETHLRNRPTGQMGTGRGRE